MENIKMYYNQILINYNTVCTYLKKKKIWAFNEIKKKSLDFKIKGKNKINKIINIFF